MMENSTLDQEQIRYVIFADLDDEENVMMMAPLDEDDRRYFVEGILPTLRPLSDDEYMRGPAVILHTLARFSYIVYRDDLYWCVEWQPGLIVLRFSADGKMAWSAIRSPVPHFGRRTPNEEDLYYANEDAKNHQYSLVFTAWDAQFDEDERQWSSFERVDAHTKDIYRAALAHVDTLGDQLEARYEATDEYDSWAEQCKQNIETWAGEGIRIAL